MTPRRSLIGWLTAICLVASLAQPGSLLAQDDDSDDDEPSAQGDDEDDESDDDSDNDEDDESDNDSGDDSDDDDGFDGPRPDQAIVNLREGVNPDTFARRHDAAVLRSIPGPNIVLLQLTPTLADEVEVEGLLEDADAEWVELNFTHQSPEGRPRYFFISSTGEPRLVDNPALPAGLDFTPAAACVTGAGIVVAVLDTGVDVSHPALVNSVLPNGVNTVEHTFDVRDIGNDFDDDADGQVDEMVGHGTHVAGIVLQVAPEARILPVKVLNSDGVGDAFMVTAGIHYAVGQGADVINLSLGSTYDSLAIRNGVEFAASQGVVVVAAAGNGDRQEPADYPAATDLAMSVAATTAGADKATYSNFHETVDISAPGNDVASAYPGGLYTTASGTSMATPIVAGSVALMLDRQPDANPDTIMAMLKVASGPLS
ncbi:MAG: S8 family serine peptidase, partial [Chloroflexia bacterium]|nr:S8 family serine peptidase [Chloroflexia bacterium]